MSIAAIIPAAGTSSRFHKTENKLFVKLNGKPVLYWSLDAFSFCDQIIVPTQRELFPKVDEIFHEYFRNQKNFEMVVGGASRAESIQNAIKVLRKDADEVMVHDAARPLISHEIITQGIQVLKQNDAVITAVKAKETIKEVMNGEIVLTPDRSKLWIAQTPQFFKKDVLQKAYAQDRFETSTDDSELVERLKLPIKVINGSYENIKLTTYEDYLFAQRILESRQLCEPA